MKEQSTRRDFLKALGIGAATAVLPGCGGSRRRSPTNINVVHPKTLERLSQANSPVMGEQEIVRSDSLVGDEAKKVENLYGNHIPPQLLNLYIADQSQVEEGKENVIQPRIFDSTGNNEQCLDEIVDVEKLIPERSNIKQIVYGTPDNPVTVASRGADRRISNQSGLRGIRNHYTPSTGDVPGFFFVEIKEKIGMSSLFKETHRYDIKITFGEEGYAQCKKIDDPVYIIKGAGAAAIGFAVAGVPGAIGTAAQVAVDAIWSYAEGRKTPRSTMIVDNRRNIAIVGDQQADTYRAFKTANDVGAEDMVVFKHSEGTALIYGKNIYSVKTQDKSLMLETDREGANFFYSMLYGLAGAATRIGSDRTHTKTKIIELPCSGCGGGDSGAPGGTVGGGGGLGGAGGR